MSFDLTLEEREGKKVIWLMLAAPRSQAGCLARRLTASFCCSFDCSLSNWEKALGIKSLYSCVVLSTKLITIPAGHNNAQNCSKYPVLDFSGTFLQLKLCICVSPRPHLQANFRSWAHLNMLGFFPFCFVKSANSYLLQNKFPLYIKSL